MKFVCTKRRTTRPSFTFLALKCSKMAKIIALKVLNLLRTLARVYNIRRELIRAVVGAIRLPICGGIFNEKD